MMLDVIVNRINQNIIRQMQAVVGEDRDIQAFGLAFPVPVIEEDTNTDDPYIILNTGEVFPVLRPDYPVGLYHRLIRKNYKRLKGGGEWNQETAELHLVCWGASNALDMSPVDFEHQVVIPSVSKDGVLISSDFDSLHVISGEFRNLNVQMSPEEFVFSLKYTVKYCLNY